MNIPSSIRLQQPYRFHGWLNRWTALYNTGQPALVLSATEREHSAVSLGIARRALLALWQPGDESGAACPTVLHFHESPNGETTLALGLRGAPLAASWPEDAGEQDVLHLALQHVQLLNRLHQAGFSGLRPEIEDIWWDPDYIAATILGWEWVKEDNQGRRDDLKRAAALWTQLLCGAPPPVFPPLTLDTDWPAWQRVSRGTRRLVVDLLGESGAALTAGLAQARIEAHRARSDQKAKELVQEGRQILATDPESAGDLFDLAARQDPNSQAASFLPYADQKTLETIDNALKQAESQLLLGLFKDSSFEFQRLALTIAPTSRRLRAWRLWTVAETGRWLVETSDTKEQFQWEPEINGLLQSISLAEAGELKRARERISELFSPDPSTPFPDALRHLRWDMEACQHILIAKTDLEQHKDTASQAFERALQISDNLSPDYRQAWLALMGEPKAGIEIAGRIKAAGAKRDAAIRAARAAEKKNDAARAEQKWYEVLRYCEPSDREWSDFRQRAYRAHLLHQALAAGAGQDMPGLETERVPAALSALMALAQAFPDDPWATESTKRWQNQLLAEIEREPQGPAAPALVRWWSDEPATAQALDVAAVQALDGWRQQLEGINASLNPATPGRVASAAATLDALSAVLANALTWLCTTSSASEAEDLLRQARERQDDVGQVQADQANLRQELEMALQMSQPVLGILDKAEEREIELYDDPQRSVAQLRAKVTEMRAAPDAVWQFNLMLAEMAQRAGDVARTRQEYAVIVESLTAPEHVRSFAQEALRLLPERSIAESEVILAKAGQESTAAESVTEPLLPEDAVLHPQIASEFDVSGSGLPGVAAAPIEAPARRKRLLALLPIASTLLLIALVLLNVLNWSLLHELNTALVELSQSTPKLVQELRVLLQSDPNALNGGELTMPESSHETEEPSPAPTTDNPPITWQLTEIQSLLNTNVQQEESGTDAENVLIHDLPQDLKVTGTQSAEASPQSGLEVFVDFWIPTSYLTSVPGTQSAFINEEAKGQPITVIMDDEDLECRLGDGSAGYPVKMINSSGERTFVRISGWLKQGLLRQVTPP